MIAAPRFEKWILRYQSLKIMNSRTYPRHSQPSKQPSYGWTWNSIPIPSAGAFRETFKNSMVKLRPGLGKETWWIVLAFSSTFFDYVLNMDRSNPTQHMVYNPSLFSVSFEFSKKSNPPTGHPNQSSDLWNLLPGRILASKNESYHHLWKEIKVFVLVLSRSISYLYLHLYLHLSTNNNS